MRSEVTRGSSWLRKVIGGLLGPLVLLAVLPAPAFAYPRPGTTERATLSSDGAEANAATSPFLAPALSADGRYVAFQSGASNLVAEDTNGVQDIFIRDRATGVTELVSLGPEGVQADSDSYDPSISADGRYVAFQSGASNLAAEDTNGAQDIFIRDRAAGATSRVSVSSEGAQADSSSYTPEISANGAYVVFQSTATNLVPGDSNGRWDVFVHELATGSSERVSKASDGTQGNGISSGATISADGRHVAFESAASNLVPGDINATSDVFVHDRDTGTTELVSVASDGAAANDSSLAPAISADGRDVAFQSSASNLVPGDTNGVKDLFVHDRDTQATEQVSVASDGAEPNASVTFTPAISGDGRRVAFGSSASNLVPGDGNFSWDVFVHDRDTQATERVSVASDGAEANNSSYDLAISADGRYVAFTAAASNLVPADTNGAADVFVHDRGGPLGIVGAPSVLKVPQGVGVSGRATFSGATLAGASDPDDDGTAVVGAELTGAALIYRPEQEDLLLRLNLAALPPVAGGLPGVLYGMELQVGETRYEIRGLRAAATADPPRAPFVALYRCAPDCTEYAPLTGSFGTTGEQILVSMPLATLGATEGTELTGLRAFTALGETTPGTLHALDEVALPASVIPTPRVELGIAPASTPADQTAFTVEADRLAGDFSGTISTDGLSAGRHRVWARACLQDACGPATFTELSP